MGTDHNVEQHDQVSRNHEVMTISKKDKLILREEISFTLKSASLLLLSLC